MFNKNRHKDIVILSLMIITFLIAAGISFGLISNVHINNKDPLTNDDLICYFTIDNSTNVNITWYNGTSRNLSTTISCTSGVECNSSGSGGTLPKEYTTKGESWTCEIGYYNTISGYETFNFTKQIGDTAPLVPKVYWSNGTETTNTTTIIPEDITSNLIVNTTDDDTSDVITYSLNDTTFCSIPTPTNGNMACNPTNESHVGSRIIKVYAESGSYRVETLWTINVTPTNDAPRFNPALITKNFTELEKFNYYITVADDENNFPLNISIISVLDENNDAGPILNITRVGNSNTTFVLVLRNNESVGSAESKHNYTVTLDVNDTDNITFNNKNTTVSFQLIGISVNKLPNISVVNFSSINQGDDLNIEINATDEDNNTLTFVSSNTALYPVTYQSATDYNVTVNGSSFAKAYVNFTGTNNSHVVYHNFTIYVFDGNGNSTRIINIIINNTNDAPYINEMSYYNNTNNNRNISNLTGYTGVLFRYRVNATDIDDLTNDSANTGLGTYITSNMSGFPIDSDGWLNFTINTSGNYSIQVNVTDRNGSTNSSIANIEIIANQVPVFSPSPINISCNETDATNSPYNCYYNISRNVTDADNISGSGDYIASYWTNATPDLFIINSTTGIINFTVNQSMVGNHTIMLNVTDSRGGMSSTTINLVINNTNNVPYMYNPNYPNGNFIVGVPYQITYTVSDLDLELPAEFSYEILNFTYNITGPNTSIFTFNQTTDRTAMIIINSSEGYNHDGNYTINVTVRDEYNNVSMRSINIYLYNQTLNPVLNQVIPSGLPFNSTINNATWRNVSDFTSYWGSPMTTIEIYENQTYTFNITATPDTRFYSNSLNYQWYYDDVAAVQTQHYNSYSDFFSAGAHNITVRITDQYNSSSSFIWYINITNVNRPPIYDTNSLQNLTITATSTIPGYLTNQDLRRRFYDPDDDPTSLLYSTDDTTNITFSSSSCVYANFTFPNHQLQVNTIAVGECRVYFFATDPLNISMIVSSEEILINITNITQSSSIPIEVPVNVQSTGGGTNTQPLPIPFPEEVEKPRPLQLVTPKLVTTYKNNTIKIPIVLNNTWNGTLVGIMLEAYTNSTNVSLYLDKVYIPKLNKGEVVEATLYVKNYKSEGHYEIQVKANITLPEYTDTATIFINSAEMRSEGEEAENKISFANDLLSSNPECQELSELLVQAKKELASENYLGTNKMIDSVINGCKYLVNNAKKNQDSPSRNFIKTFEWKKNYNDYIIIGIFGMLFLASLYYILKKDNPEQDF